MEREPAKVSTPSSSISSPRIIPEYESVRGVVMAPGGVLFRDKAMPGSYLEAFVRERIEIYTGIVNSTPELTHVFLADPSFTFNGIDEPQAFKDRILPLLSPIARSVKAFWTNVSDPSSDYADEWTRDYSPLWIRDSSATSPKPLIFTTRGMEVSKAVAAIFAPATSSQVVDIIDTEKLEGGNIMSDSLGRCYTTLTVSATSRLRHYCSEIVTLPRLPMEGTGHVDLFAKIVSARDVVIASYRDDDVSVMETVSESRYTCSDDDAKNARWNNCDQAVPDLGPNLVLKTDQSGAHVRVPSNSLLSYAKQMFTTSETAFMLSSEGNEVNFDKEIEGPNWKGHSNKVTSTFSSLGFNVARIENPRPVARCKKETYLSSTGSVVHTLIRINVVFPSYANSLLVNGTVFVPEYKIWASRQQNLAAQAAYGRISFENKSYRSHPLAADFAILGSGAVHCLTSQVAL